MRFDTRPVRHAYEVIAHDYAAKFADEITTNAFDRSVIDDAIEPLDADAVVIDVGCGPGQVAAHLSARGMHAAGVDLTPAMLTIARQREPYLPLVCGDVLNLPFRASRVDGIVAWYSLHNLPRPILPAALSEFRSALRRGGRLLIATHCGRGEEHIKQERNGEQETVVITSYEPEELASLLVDHGFRTDATREREPLSHEHQANKIYVIATRQ